MPWLQILKKNLKNIRKQRKPLSAGIAGRHSQENSWGSETGSLRREWGFAPLCGAAATFSGRSKDPSRLFRAMDYRL